MDPEIASFVLKFQNLCREGKSANLLFTSNTGNVSVNLSLQIGRLSDPPQASPPPHFPQEHRYGPSKVRRKQKRAVARRAFAEEAMRELSTEEVDVLKEAENAENGKTRTDGLFGKETETVLKEVDDEICPDDAYNGTENEAEEVDAEELARDKNIEKVIVSAVTKPIEKKFDVEEEIRDKFAGIGVEVKGMKTITDSRGKFHKSLVETSKVNLKLIWGRRLGLKNCCVVAFEG